MERQFKIVASFDTETSTLGEGASSRAFACLYVFSDIRAGCVRRYEPDCDFEHIALIRSEYDCQRYLDELVEFGRAFKIVPVVVAYNLMFDLQSIIFDLSRRYDMRTCARSSTQAYYIDLLDEEGLAVLRFWDVFHLETNGVAAMGATCGFDKRLGDWDYSLVRLPSTPLTDREIGYATGDVQVLLRYLRYILEANPYLEESDLGCRVLTKTSLVRQMGERVIGAEVERTRRGDISLSELHIALCKRELPSSYRKYALRKGAFRGGLTFTATSTMMKTAYDVVSLDVTSMHHAFINGAYVPVGFRCTPSCILQSVAQDVAGTPVDYVLRHYERPFLTAFHAYVAFDNIRLKEPFKSSGIATLAESKFGRFGSKVSFEPDEAAEAADRCLRKNGYVDYAENPVFAASKLMSARHCELCLTEIELYIVSLVYDFDSMKVLFGEATSTFIRPPDYLCAQSMLLFKRKAQIKELSNSYEELVPYDVDIGESVPEEIASAARSGTLDASFLKSYYTSTVKGAFNAIYGTQAQDVFKPSFLINDGCIEVDEGSVASPDNFDERQPKSTHALYTQGMRIVGRSRLHLTLGIYSSLKCGVEVLGGDTDSLKIALNGRRVDDVLDSLTSLHAATRKMLDYATTRIAGKYPQYFSTLDHVGEFDVENKTPYPKHYEAWNKARMSLDSNGRVHVTCAGLSRPKGAYTVETLAENLIAAGRSFEEIAPLILGFNSNASYDVSHSLMRNSPQPFDVVNEEVRDYLGNTEHVFAHQAVALYPIERELADVCGKTVHDSVVYLKEQGRDVDLRIKHLRRDEILIVDEKGAVYVDCRGDNRSGQGDGSLQDANPVGRVPLHCQLATNPDVQRRRDDDHRHEGDWQDLRASTSVLEGLPFP